MSAIKDKIQWYQYLVDANREKGIIDASLERDLDVTKEISDRLDALEKKAHEHNPPVSVVSQSPMPVEVPPSSTLYTGDTERSCGNCNLLVGCKVVLSSGQDCCDFWEQYVPRQKQPTQEQLWICPKAKDCPCNEHILEKPSCNHVVPHKKSRMCESASSVCPECIPYAQEQGGDDDEITTCSAPVYGLNGCTYRTMHEFTWGCKYKGVCEYQLPKRPKPPKEQGGDDLPSCSGDWFAYMQKCFSQVFDFAYLANTPASLIHAIIKDKNELRARLAKAEKENAELKRQLNSEVKG